MASVLVVHRRESAIRERFADAERRQQNESALRSVIEALPAVPRIPVLQSKFESLALSVTEGALDGRIYFRLTWENRGCNLTYQGKNGSRLVRASMRPQWRLSCKGEDEAKASSPETTFRKLQNAFDFVDLRLAEAGVTTCRKQECLRPCVSALRFFPLNQMSDPVFSSTKFLLLPATIVYDHSPTGTSGQYSANLDGR